MTCSLELLFFFSYFNDKVCDLFCFYLFTIPTPSTVSRSPFSQLASTGPRCQAVEDILSAASGSLVDSTGLYTGSFRNAFGLVTWWKLPTGCLNCQLLWLTGEKGRKDNFCPPADNLLCNWSVTFDLKNTSPQSSQDLGLNSVLLIQTYKYMIEFCFPGQRGNP